MGKKALDLFCGAGGASKGFQRAGMDVVGGIDKDPEAISTYETNHEDVLALEKDIANVDFQDLPNLESLFLLHASPPCQTFSNANRHKGKESSKDYLYKEVVRYADHFQPKYILMENVQGIKKLLKEIKRDFSEVDYELEAFYLNAEDFGIPQNRKRLFFLGMRRDIADIDASFDLTSIQMNISSKKESEIVPLKDALWVLRELKAKEEKLKTEENNERSGFYEDELLDDTPTEYVLEINEGDIPSTVFNHKARYHNDRDIEIYSRLPQGENATHESVQDIMPYKLGSFKDKYYKLQSNRVSKTITAHMDKDCNSYIHPHESRGLTPREAARIQSFPDNFEIRGNFTAWYRQIGNAVPPLLAETIAQSILEHHEG